MRGIDIARAYYEAFGLPMLKEQFPDLLPYIACGLTGSGSECYGFDDDVSTDHDFEPGFCIFLPSEEIVSRRRAFELERAYAKLPKEFMGIQKSLMNPVGGPRRGVFRTSEYFMEKTGSKDGILTLQQWLTIPEYALAEAVNGEIFSDAYGEVTAIRSSLRHYPEDVRRKKLAGAVLLMAQSGQYNYQRCLKHGETGAAQLAVFEFARNTMETVFLLNQVYQPYYKWSFRALRQLDTLSIEAELLEYLLTTDNDANAEEKYNVIEGIASDIIDELIGQKLSEAVCGDLEKHAYSINDGIEDAQLRNMHILSAVQEGL